MDISSDIKYLEQHNQFASWWEKQTNWKTKAAFSRAVQIPESTIKDYFAGRSSPKGENRRKLFEITGLECFTPLPSLSLQSSDVVPLVASIPLLPQSKRDSPLLITSHVPSNTVRSEDMTFVEQVIKKGYYLGKSPFFVLGAGVSDGIVPYLSQMAQWLVNKLKEKGLNNELFLQQGQRIVNNKALRNDAAEFFSTMRDNENATTQVSVWREFSESLVEGPFDLPNDLSFKGLLQLDAKDASLCHLGIAGLLSANACHVLNLNFDPLLYRAFEYLRNNQNEKRELNLITLYQPKDIIRYFGSSEKIFQPAAASARGDIFYVKCQNKNCPAFDQERPLTSDKVPAAKSKGLVGTHPFRCPVCHLDTLTLELSFPSYHTKELLIQPMLAQLQEYVAAQTSIIVMIGLSGKWDPYLLAGIFNWAKIYSTPIIDIRPKLGEADKNKSDVFIDDFRALYFPGVSNFGNDETSAWYRRLDYTADSFLKQIYPVIQNCIGSLPKLKTK
jgi:hypothetical protein